MKRAGGRVDHAGRCKVAAEDGRPKLKTGTEGVDLLAAWLVSGCRCCCRWACLLSALRGKFLLERCFTTRCC
jgi:hypothetical protein